MAGMTFALAVLATVLLVIVARAALKVGKVVALVAAFVVASSLVHNVLFGGETDRAQAWDALGNAGPGLLAFMDGGPVEMLRGAAGVARRIGPVVADEFGRRAAERERAAEPGYDAGPGRWRPEAAEEEDPYGPPEERRRGAGRGGYYGGYDGNDRHGSRYDARDYYGYEARGY